MSDDNLNLKDKNKPSGPVVVGKLTIEVDRDMCIGAATCIAVAPNTYLLDSQAKAIILDTAEKDDEQTQLDSARACPVGAIYLKDENGKVIYPD